MSEKRFEKKKKYLTRRKTWKQPSQQAATP
jgi:hypothetical protein